MTETLAVAVTLFLIMDPLGNTPIFMSVLKKVAPQRRLLVMIRELIIALGIMLLFLFSGPSLLNVLGLTQEAVAIGGGLVLLIIALRMIFPSRGGIIGDEEDTTSEPLIVPLATPLIAGPSLIATLVLLAETGPDRSADWLTAVGLAWLVTAIILLASNFFYKVLGERGLKAAERLMGMILISISVQMLLDGVESYISHL